MSHKISLFYTLTLVLIYNRQMYLNIEKACFESQLEFPGTRNSGYQKLYLFCRIFEIQHLVYKRRNRTYINNTKLLW